MGSDRGLSHPSLSTVVSSIEIIKLLSFNANANRACYFEEYCSKWFNKHFCFTGEHYYFMSLSLANDSADQSSSFHTSFYFTAHWPLYCSCAMPAAGNDRKKLWPSLSQRRIQSGPRKGMFPQSRWAGITQNTAGYLQRDWPRFDVIGEDQLRGLKSSRAVGNPTVCLLPSFLPVCVFGCDRAPHRCSDVSSLCPYSMTVTPS